MLGARGLVVLDADAEARRVVEEPAVLAAVQARFGGQVVRDGRLDRGAMAALVFGDPAARAALEAITHPAIRARLVAGLEAALAAGRSVVLDVPLLLEGGLVARCDVAVFVDAAAETRAARARARGWSAAELARREAAQADLAVKRQLCTHTITTDGTLADVRRQVDALLAGLAAGPSPRR
jgi:dephospho-CoA kinase